MPYSSRLCLSIRGWKTERTSLFIVFINLTMRSCVAVEIVLCIVFSSHHVENKITRRVTDGGAAEGAVSPSSHLFPPLEEKRGNVQVIYFYPPPVQCVCPRLKNPVENRRTPVTPIFYLIFSTATENRYSPFLHAAAGIGREAHRRVAAAYDNRIRK